MARRGGVKNPMFEPIEAPNLTSLVPKDVAEFFHQRKQYIRKIQERRTTHNERINATSLLLSIEPKLLQVICELRIRDVPEDQVTDDHLELYLKKLLKPKDAVYDIEQIVREQLKYDISISDADARLMKLFMEFNEIVEKEALAEMFMDEAGMKMKAKLIIEALRPEAVRRMATNALKFNHREARKDCRKLFDVLLRIVTNQDEVHRASHPHGGERHIKGDQEKQDKKSNGHEPARVTNREASHNGTSKYWKGSWKPRTEKPTDGCLKCGGGHWLSECQQRITKEEREKLIAEFKNKKALGKVETRAKKVTRREEEETVGIFGQGCQYPTQLDSGADRTYIPGSLLKEIQRKNPKVQLVHQVIKVQFAAKRASCDGIAPIVRGFVDIPVTIGTAVGDITLPLVRCWVMDAEMETVLIGKPELTCLGIDPTTALEKLIRHQTEDSEAESYAAAKILIAANDDMKADHTGEGSEDLEDAKRDMIRRTVGNGADDATMEALKAIIDQVPDLFRVRLGADPPANVRPMRIHLKEGSRPRRCKPRRYPPSHSDFLREFVKELETNGYVYRNIRSRYTSPVLVVPKPNNRGYRMTVDLRGINADTEPVAWPMPSLEIVMGRLAGASYFATLDAYKGYWQFPLAEESQELLSFMTDEGVYTPTRVVQGATDAVACFQAGMQEALGDYLYKNTLLWIDDLLIFAPTVQELLENLRLVFKRLDLFGIKLNARRCDLFNREVHWCGRIISGTGIRFDPKLVESLRNMEEPQNAGELQQFICALGWLRVAIPEFTKHIHFLQEAKNEAMKIAGSSKRNVMNKVKLSEIGWDERHRHSFQHAKEVVANVVELAHPDADKPFCLFTDASDQHWAVVLTQVPEEDIGLEDISQLRHAPLVFLSGTFKGASLQWSTIEKEAFPIIEAVGRLRHFLLREKGFVIFTDHRNLVYILDPSERASEKRRHVCDRLERWATKLLAYKYSIRHISGSDNVWADLLTRWAQHAETEGRAAAIGDVSINQRVRPLHATTFVWPDLGEITAIQNAYKEHIFSDTMKDGVHADNDDVFKTGEGKIWIPSEELAVRIMIIAHSSSAGHRGVEATLEAVKARFWWKNMRNDILKFVRECLHCEANKGTVIPRPFGEALHADRPNKLLHYDFLFMDKMKAKGENPYIYILVVQDDFSSYRELFPAKNADHRVVVNALLSWFSRFGVVHQTVSDQGAHFKNEVMKELNTRLNTKHHFTTAYVPWANGTVERVNRDLLFVVRALLSELRLQSGDWPDLLPLVQMSLNHTASQRFGRFAPITVFTGLPASSPLDAIYSNRSQTVVENRLDAEKIKSMTDGLRRSLDEIHKAVKRSTDKKRQLERDRRLRKGNVVKINFDKGDYVLISREIERRLGKLQTKWRGPARIVNILSDWIYEVEDLVTHDRREVHASRMKFYSDASLNVDADLYDQCAHDSAGYEVAEFLGLRKHADVWEIKVRWRGWADGDETWEPLKNMLEDVPAMTERWLKAAKTRTAREAARDLGIPVQGFKWRGKCNPSV